ncbi:MAG: phosphatase PAP2 family protein [Clostridiales bacterium]|nr:phosphatase PAP2 family protein [Clostridiales bacterium]
MASMLFNLISSTDSSVLLFVQDHVRNPILNPVMIFFSVIGNAGFIWLVLSVYLIVTKKHRQKGFLLLICITLCYVLNDFIIKSLIQRPRPFLYIDELDVLLKRFSASSSWSFPSGHACSSFASAFALYRGFGKKGALFYIPAVLISFSRVYVGVHHPSDVVCGAIVGTIGSAVIVFLIGRFYRYRNGK